MWSDGIEKKLGVVTVLSVLRPIENSNVVCSVSSALWLDAQLVGRRERRLLLVRHEARHSRCVRVNARRVGRLLGSLAGRLSVVAGRVNAWRVGGQSKVAVQSRGVVCSSG